MASDPFSDSSKFPVPSGGSSMFPPKPTPRSAPVTYTNTIFPARPIGLGQQGAEVRAIQEEICRRGYKVKVDGYYGLDTLDGLETIGCPILIDEKTYDLILKGHDFSRPDPATFKFTGRKVKIMATTATANGLKNGEIRDELDGSVIEPDRTTGVYVLGGPEEGFSVPIKLKHKLIIVDEKKPYDKRPYTEIVDEFEFQSPDPEATLISILSRAEKLDRWDDYEYMLKWIEKCGSEEGREGFTLEWWAESICRRLGLVTADEKKMHTPHILKNIKAYVARQELIK